MTIMTKPFEMTTPIFDASAIDEALPSFEPVYLDPTQVKFRYAGENLTMTLTGLNQRHVCFGAHARYRERPRPGGGNFLWP
jgi:hypothetical protein